MTANKTKEEAWWIAYNDCTLSQIAHIQDYFKAGFFAGQASRVGIDKEKRLEWINTYSFEMSDNLGMGNSLRSHSDQVSYMRTLLTEKDIKIQELKEQLKSHIETDEAYSKMLKETIEELERQNKVMIEALVVLYETSTCSWTDTVIKETLEQIKGIKE